MKKYAIILLVVSCLLIISCETVIDDIILLAQDAELQGNLVLETGERDTPNIGWWSSLDDLISWDLEIVADGNYGVYVNLACLPLFAGSVITISNGSAYLTLTVPSTGAWETYSDVYAGAFLFSGGTYTLTLQAASIAEPSTSSERYVANIRHITLTAE
ncbi:MAG: hypothetical protein JW874_00810 [Spirochaetales bacterium]|nr:hypothetical protein [Spirochaetales bacterium]